ncbi:MULTISPECIES: iron-siderophore ABC transporter substrate-binding protein [unclassified Crossiella]|uniref:iron-siderophore ABC transporter substrate-binding protein n=1 Tax=unclassified Crossiella TaxID=2620835 RepID=UPI002000511B|nr:MULTISPECIES: iron-siderophore ABC transporter substrate-binding protein [unclassified Crossiella]MCK2245076.1 iron-siderophore ABC transporter substrate-binding protein [Crossiella sp. S99.2]MCK2258657.1 iron-siderophore ABC transporter substrate-binding protein [Crossiella sp. S99.1]
MTTGTRLLAAAATALLGLGTLVACGGGGEQAPQTTASTDAFPVTLKHKLGSTTITAPPKRIVALSTADQDALLALGVQPIAMVRMDGHPDGITPWAKAKLGGATPTLLVPGDNGFDPEQVLKLEPDLILANFDAGLDKYWSKLNAIVPTTGYETGSYQDSWQQVTRQVGQAIGRKALADQVIGEAEARIAGVRKTNPELTGKRFGYFVAGQAGTVHLLKSTEDTATKLLGEFGLVLPDNIRNQPGGTFAVELSAEKFDLLDQDVLLSYYGNEQQRDAVEQNPLFQKLAVVRKGGKLILALPEFHSIRAPSPLSIPYAIDKLVPMLSAAVKKTAA